MIPANSSSQFVYPTYQGKSQSQSRSVYPAPKDESLIYNILNALKTKRNLLDHIKYLVCGMMPIQEKLIKHLLYNIPKEFEDVNIKGTLDVYPIPNRDKLLILFYWVQQCEHYSLYSKTTNLLPTKELNILKDFYLNKLKPKLYTLDEQEEYCANIIDNLLYYIKQRSKLLDIVYVNNFITNNRDSILDIKIINTNFYETIDQSYDNYNITNKTNIEDFYNNYIIKECDVLSQIQGIICDNIKNANDTYTNTLLLNNNKSLMIVSNRKLKELIHLKNSLKQEFNIAALFNTSYVDFCNLKPFFSSFLSDYKLIMYSSIKFEDAINKIKSQVLKDLLFSLDLIINMNIPRIKEDY